MTNVRPPLQAFIRTGATSDCSFHPWKNGLPAFGSAVLYDQTFPYSPISSNGNIGRYLPIFITHFILTELVAVILVK
ncbi:hypothetical protein [Xylanibacillus composti]|uniref:hypothetical protein n=1 Tax=Xylanibacillus composti TaxID=1572762 RepID=UPI001BCC8D5E|nr:hypothetical protein [Xylanibacillus composti]